MGALETMQLTINRLEIDSHLFSILLGLDNEDFTIRSSDGLYTNGTPRIEVRKSGAFPQFTYEVKVYKGRDPRSWDEEIHESIFHSAKDMVAFVRNYLKSEYQIEWRL